MSLNKAQQDAVDFNGGNLLIVAGPGTGKTHTLTHRIVRLAETLAYGQQVLAITFTNKATQEMRERLLTTDPRLRVTVVTFHQFCLNILREHADHLSEEFAVAGEEEVGTVAKVCWPDLKPKARHALLDKISLAKSDLSSETFDEWEQYDHALRQECQLDYDDLLREAVLLLHQQPAVLYALREQFPFICVDEYQDINAMQHALLKVLIGEEVTITAIGDPHQAIYGFRGARVEFFEQFAQDFDAAVMSLDQNYRSRESLLAASAQVIEKDEAVAVPPLTAQLFEHGRLVVHQTATDKAEAEFVVHEIERLLGGTSMFSHDSGRVDVALEGEVSFGDIAVLYRLNAQSHALRHALDRSGIPYGVAGRQKVEEDPYDIAGERVVLLTLHAAKGLEFPVVFIIGCEQGLLPMDLGGLRGDPQEERRLFYVGMTRAKHALYLTHTRKRILFGQTREPELSPFVQDIHKQFKEITAQQPRPQKQTDKHNQIELF